MRRIALSLLFSLLATSALIAQTPVVGGAISTSGDITTEGGTLTLTIPPGRNYTTLGVSASGTWTGTIAVQCAARRETDDFVAIRLTPRNSTTGVTSFTANNQWSGAIDGCQRVQAIATAAMTGTAVITLTGGFGSGGGSGGGGGGTFDGVLVDAPGGDSITDTVNDALRVNIIAGAGSGGTAMTDDNAFTAATTSITPAGAMFDDTAPDSVNENDAGVMRMSANRNLYSTIRDAAGNERGVNVTAGNALTVDGSAVTQPVSGTVTANLSATDNAVLDDIADGITVTATNLDVQIGGSDSLTIGTFPDNEPFNVAQINGVTPLMGVGASGTGALRTATLIHDGTDIALVDGSGNLQITGAVSCSNCTGSGASDVEGSTFTLGTDSVAPAGFYYDNTTPTNATEDRMVAARVSANRHQYVQIGDGADNERWASVTANNELLVELGAGAASIGTLGANSGVDIGDVTLTASDNDIGNVDLELAGTAVSATNPVAVRFSDGSGFVALASDTTVGSAIGTSGPLGLAVYSDFDGSALPTITNVDTEGEGVPVAASIKGVQYFMPTNEDGSLTPLVVEDVAETAANVLMGAGTVRRDVAASSAGTTGDNATLNTDSLGQLWVRQLDPCSGVAKTVIPINISTATTTELTAALSGASNYYYVCSILLGPTAGAQNIAIVDDDTDGCGSVTSGLAGGTTAGTGFNIAANGGLSFGNGNGTIMKTGGTNRVICAVTSAAVQISGVMTVVAAP